MLDLIKDMFKNPGVYRKFWMALAGAAVFVLTRLFGLDNAYVSGLIQLLAALGVLGIPNERK